jgi:hypothetical protein
VSEWVSEWESERVIESAYIVLELTDEREVKRVEVSVVSEAVNHFFGHRMPPPPLPPLPCSSSFHFLHYIFFSRTRSNKWELRRGQQAWAGSEGAHPLKNFAIFLTVRFLINDSHLIINMNVDAETFILLNQNRWWLIGRFTTKK